MKINNNKRKIITLLACIGISFAINIFAQEISIENMPLADNSAGMDLLKNTLNNNPNSKTAKILCAKVLLKNGNYKESEKLIMEILEEDPTNTKASKLLKELNIAYSDYQRKLSEKQLIVNEEKIKIEIKDKDITKQTTEPKKSKNKKKKEIDTKENQFSVVAEPLGDSTNNELISEDIDINKPSEIEKIQEDNKFKTKSNLPSKEEILRKAKLKNNLDISNSEEKNIIKQSKDYNNSVSNISSNNEIIENNTSDYNKVELLEPIIIKNEINEEIEEESSLSNTNFEKKTPF